MESQNWGRKIRFGVILGKLDLKIREVLKKVEGAHLPLDGE